MADLAVSGGYTVDDLRWLRESFNVPVHVELDPWGSPVVSPVDDDHEIARVALIRQAGIQLERAHVVPSMPWMVPGGSGYLMIPDLTVLPAGWRRDGEWGFDPAPLLIVEVSSRSTRHADRTRKLADYRLGAAGLYLLVDLPATFEAHILTTGDVVTATGEIDLLVGGEPVHFTLPSSEEHA